MTSSSAQRIVIATRQTIDGVQRKLAWFSVHPNDLYCEITVMPEGSHNSYHKDGNMFRTSPATDQRATLMSTRLPWSQFKGWCKLGLGVVLKSSLAENPPLRSRDRKGFIHEVDIDVFPSNALNLMAELADSAGRSYLSSPEMCPPPDAQVIELPIPPFWIIVTILGHTHNLLISPYDGQFQGVTCRHFNNRYSANPAGSSCYLEAYKRE
jgi:hypothetical protein